LTKANIVGSSFISAERPVIQQWNSATLLMKIGTMRNRPKANGRMLRFEPLETRALLAGNITASVNAGELDITGDAASNSVLVWQTGANTWKVQGIGTTLNGSHATFTAPGVTGNIEANLNAGNNFIKVFSGAVPGALDILTGKDNDTVQVTNVTTGLSTVGDGSSLIINVSNGNNAVTLSGVTTRGEAQINSGNGNAVISLSNVTANTSDLIGDNFVDTGNGKATISLANVSMSSTKADNFVDTGDGTAIISLANVSMNTTLADNFVDTGNGTAIISLANVSMNTSEGDNFVDTGNGKATISLVNVGMHTSDAVNFVDTGNGTATISISKSTMTTSGNGSENSVETGDATAVISMWKVTMSAVDGDNTITTGDGKDVVALTYVTVEGDLSIKTKGGTDAVSLNSVNVGSSDMSVDVGPGNYDSLAVVNCIAGTEEFSDTGGTHGTIVGALNDFATPPVVTSFSHEYGI
jgi:fibronectin-binding autotransporter adhesin